MTKEQNHTLAIHKLGLIEYHKADTLQREIQKKRILEQAPDTVLLLEHPNVITLGTRGSMTDILAESSVLKEKNVQIVHTDRGGQNTVHAPGQLVGYVIINLYKEKRALRKFVFDLEKSLIDTLDKFGIHAYHHETHVGVWTDFGKIAAIGISVNHGVTRHGFALNVSTALDVFSLIVPCGITQGKVCNMEQILGTTLAMQEVKDAFVKIFATQRGYDSVSLVQS